MDNFLSGGSLLITGGAGSFGRHMVRWALRHTACPRICILSRDEDKHRRLNDSLLPVERARVRFFLGDVRDYNRMRVAMRGITHVIHAAALKQVPAGEYNPDEFVQTNTVGSINVARAAVEAGVERAILLSTDKACAPVNLYGATKLCAEKAWRATAGDGVFAAVRYGNVMGSRGSVFGVWRDAIEQKEPITITHRDMTRFWMTVHDAVALVVYAMRHADPGELLIPKLDAFRIFDLATVMWSEYASGERELRFIGIRPGEKLHESLMTPEETGTAFERSEVYVLPGTELGNDQALHPRGSYENRVSSTFRYRSDNVRMMAEAELRAALPLVSTT